MASKQLSIWQRLKKSLKTLLIKSEEIQDFIVFGSLVKGKYAPKDIDIALVVGKKNISLTGEAKEQLGNFSNLDLEMITPEEMYQTRLGMVLITEGFSIKRNKFLREELGISPMKIYVYEIKSFTQTRKVLFGRGLNLIIKNINGTRLGAGCVMIPISHTAEFEDFLDTWNLKYSTKEYTVL